MTSKSEIHDLAGGWEFGGAYRPGDESGSRKSQQWETVTLPHSVTKLSWKEWDPQTWDGKWIYRRNIDSDHVAAGKRVFIDFDGVLTSSQVYFNGQPLGSHSGGYLPFSYDVTDLLKAGKNQLVVVADGSWQQIPPDGHPKGVDYVDFMQPAGIHRAVKLRVEPEVRISELIARAISPPTGLSELQAEASVSGAAGPGASVRFELIDRTSKLVVATGEGAVTADGKASFDFSSLDVARWSPDSPVLYDVVARLIDDGNELHSSSKRVGFRHARFEADGFYLNGEKTRLFGLNRHSIYPYLGLAVPERVDRRDAEILKNDLNCNIVRCAHYPHTEAFLDACDELGIMVWDEIPGWIYIGGQDWKQQWFADVDTMIKRDRHHSSVIVWGVTPNESLPGVDDALVAKEIATRLDPTRQTSGTCTQHDWPKYVQDVFSYDDYHSVDDGNGRRRPAMRPALPGRPYFVGESVGAITGPHWYRRALPQREQQEQALLHAEAHNHVGDPSKTYAGLTAWLAFDYASRHGYTWKAIKTPGVMDGFRNWKPGAAFYRSQVDPARKVVIEPAFYWDFSPASPVTTLGTRAAIFSNCDSLRVTVGNGREILLQPAHQEFPHLKYPPFFFDVSQIDSRGRPDLTIKGYVGGQEVLTRQFSGSGRGDKLVVAADDSAIIGDGRDATRVSFAAVDRFGAPRPYVKGKVEVKVTGPATLVGDPSVNFGESGGAAAVWIKGKPGATGKATITVSHRRLGVSSTTVEIGAQARALNDRGLAA